MPERMTATYLTSYLAFPFAEARWRERFALGAALVLAAFVIPIIPLVFVYGYLLRVMRQAAEDDELSLPAWEDWGQLGSDGLRAMIVSTVALLPGVLIVLLGTVFYFLAITAVEAAPYGNPDEVLTQFWTLMGGMGIAYLAMALGTLLLVVGLVPMPMALAHLAAENRLGVAFRPREWWPLIRAARWDYFAAWVVIVGLGGISYWCALVPSYTVVLCCLTPLVGAPLALYVGLVGAAVFGSTYRRARADREQGSEGDQTGEENAQPLSDVSES